MGCPIPWGGHNKVLVAASELYGLEAAVAEYLDLDRRPHKQWVWPKTRPGPAQRNPVR